MMALSSASVEDASVESLGRNASDEVPAGSVDVEVDSPWGIMVVAAGPIDHSSTY